MDINRLTLGEKIAAGSAIALFIFMFFSWFGIEVSGPGGFEQSIPDAGGSAWDTLDLIRFVLLLTIIAAIALAVTKANRSRIDLPVSLSVIVAGLGILSTLLILYRVINPPDFGISGLAELGGAEIDTTRKIGLFLGLIAAAALAFGGFKAMQEEGTSFQEAGDQLRDRSDDSGSGPGAGPGAGPSGGTGTPPPPPAGGTGGTAPPPPPPPPSSNV